VKEAHLNIRDCAVIILAGGKSARLGKAKQLLPYGDKNLLQHAVDTALLTGLSPIVVVLGARGDIISEVLTGRPVKIVVNSEWEEGMASSVRCGINDLLRHSPNADGTIIMVCDQPFVSAGLLDSLLVTQHETGKPVIAATYDGIAGTPVLFHRNMFAALMELKGDKGARKFLEQHPQWVATVPFPEGKLDIDTETDYENLQLWKKNPAT
jgi:molybdenum cofactor cytidylyltransferase